MKTRPLRSRDVRERNEKLVLKLIYNRRGISQSEVAALTGLKPPTVFRIFTNLIDQGFIAECRTDRMVTEKKGRKPSFFCVNPAACYAVGLDFWWQSAAVLIVDFSGRPIHEDLVRFEVGIDADKMMRRIEGQVRVAFTINPDGSVSDPEVIEAEPPGYFEQSALRAIRHWKFQPKIAGGVAVAHQATQTIRYALQN